jgi:hypothetical protein
MSRGFIFSVDAALALVIVMIAVAAVSQAGSPNAGEEVSAQLKIKAVDKGVVGFYTTKIADTPVHEQIGPSVEFGECSALYAINPNGVLGSQSTPVKSTFCEET